VAPRLAIDGELAARHERGAGTGPTGAADLRRPAGEPPSGDLGADGDDGQESGRHQCLEELGRIDLEREEQEEHRRCAHVK
jgi:hypothetical protein